MRKLLVLVLMLMLTAMVLIFVSCEKEVETQPPVLQTSKVQTTDAISGKPIDKSVYVDYKGRRIYFCCDDSKKGFETNSATVLRKLKEQGVMPEKTPFDGN